MIRIGRHDGNRGTRVDLEPDRLMSFSNLYYKRVRLLLRFMTFRFTIHCVDGGDGESVLCVLQADDDGAGHDQHH